MIADAEIELGRYRDAARTIQRLVDTKPGLPAYARVSYYRELHGDVIGALRAMRYAVSAGSSEEGTRVCPRPSSATSSWTRGRHRRRARRLP